jgi:hypothetical protein
LLLPDLAILYYLPSIVARFKPDWRRCRCRTENESNCGNRERHPHHLRSYHFVFAVWRAQRFGKLIVPDDGREGDVAAVLYVGHSFFFIMPVRQLTPPFLLLLHKDVYQSYRNVLCT